MPPRVTEEELVREAQAAGLLNPYQSYSFIAEFGWIAGFSEIEGLIQTIKTIEIEECTEPFQSTVIPTRHSYSNIVLKRGKTKNTELLIWWRQATGQSFNPNFRRAGQLHLVQPQTLQILATWSVKSAYPVRFEQSAWVAKESGLAVETLELVHEGVQEVEPGKAR